MIDFTLLSSIVTVLAVAAFIAIVGWAVSPRQTHRFDVASKLPFAVPDDIAEQQPPTRARR
jgi:cbb3-type cytochrome oxidase subunit 3